MRRGNEIPVQQLSAEWHQYRAKRITSTDVAAIVGYYASDPEIKAELCKYKTAYQVWARLSGRYTPEVPETAAMVRGRFGEEVACVMFEQETGQKIRRPVGVMQHPELSWLCASPDGEISESNRGVEVKCPLPATYHEWRDGTPLRYEIQTRIAMACGNYDSALVIVGRSGIEHQLMERNRAFESNLIGICERFLDEFVRPDREPEAYDFDSDAPVMDELLRRLDTSAVRLTDDAALDLAEFRKLRDLRIRTEKAEKASKLRVAAFLKSRDADVGVAKDGSGVVWRVDARGVRKLLPVVKVKREDIRRVK